MPPNHARQLEEIRRFKKRYSGPLPDHDPNYNYLENFPLMTNYLRQHGKFPPMLFESDSDSDDLEEPESDPEEPEDYPNEPEGDPEENGGYMSNPEFENSDDENEAAPMIYFQDNDDENEVGHPNFDMHGWLADYEAEADAQNQIQNPVDPPLEPESDPESEVDDPLNPPPITVGMRLPNWAPIDGHLADLQRGE